MLAIADSRGEVMASVPGLADVARVTEEECDDALRRFTEPDRRSRSQELEGRRVVVIDGGWRLVNHAKYRKILSAEERRDYDRWRKRNVRGQSAMSAMTPSDSKFLQTAPAPAPAPAPKELEASLSEPAAPAPAAIAIVRDVFECWQRVHVHPTARLDPKRIARIRGALKLRSAGDLCQAIRGALKDDWLMGRDLKSPRKYDGLETILRDAAQIERLIDLETGKTTAKRVGGGSKQPDCGLTGLEKFKGVLG